ncbi:hypothetical protein ACFWMR_01970 [Amycolatopsis thailandensis]|uniref:hypothetical protein n=1 Tax=Amycolatopsis thailandensis TaxID=589330 RepID=UPI0036634B7E
MTDILDLLSHVVARQAVTSHPGAIGTKTGFASSPPINLDALELQQELARWRWTGSDYAYLLEERAWTMVEQPPHVPLGLCPCCSSPVSCEFDRVSAQCGMCGEWLNRADAVAEARRYVEATWMTPGEIETETRTWGTPVRAGRVRKWRYRGQITAREDGRYRLADVLKVLDRQAAAA